MKIALCFIISYTHSLNKEELWRKWIEKNKDICNIYVHYKDQSLIQSEWLKQYALPVHAICQTSYTHVVQAYMSLMSYASRNDSQNQWFCFLTESCVPIISPSRFRRLFFQHYRKSILQWRKAWWNVHFCRRANLYRFQEEFHLANDPWFVLKREDVHACIRYSQVNPSLFRLICDGSIANESIFAIMLHSMNKLRTVLPCITHVTDWSRMSSATSPYVFKEGSTSEVEFITTFIKKNPYSMFLRKVDTSFPDKVLETFIIDKESSSIMYYYYYLTYYNKLLFACILFSMFVFGFFLTLVSNTSNDLRIQYM